MLQPAQVYSTLPVTTTERMPAFSSISALIFMLAPQLVFSLLLVRYNKMLELPLWQYDLTQTLKSKSATPVKVAVPSSDAETASAFIPAIEKGIDVIGAFDISKDIIGKDIADI